MRMRVALENDAHIIPLQRWPTWNAW